MRYIKNIRLWLAALLLLMLLTGCELLRSDDGAGDITSSVNEPKAATGTPPIGDAFPLEQAPDTGGVIYFQPSNPQLMTGSTMTIDIFVANVENMNGADIQINFNPTIIQLDDAVSNQEGVQIQPGNFLAPDFIAENEVNNQTGAISYIVIQIPPTPPVSGTGLMATLIVRGVNEGTSDLTFTSVLLTNSNIEQIPVTSQNGQIIVGPSTGEPTDTPTATTTPVDGATATPTFTATITPTITPSVTITATATITPTIEPTATPTFTPSPPPPPTATPLPTEPPKPQVKIPRDATFGICYWVKGNDTIHSIARKYNTTPQAINIANDLFPPNHTFQNQVLFIPFWLGNGPNVYETVSDEVTLKWLAEECNITVEDLLAANNLPAGFDPPKGFPLIIPIPPFPPPSRFRYPIGPLPIVPPGCCGGPPDVNFVERK
ncbi:MAG: LysM peptidoglycan-binding domain-containing protein [Anaerolineales bacterium]|nr:LysM peptidoglycan-binding domain-containing protein [Anaerolineales bacterium]